MRASVVLLSWCGAPDLIVEASSGDRQVRVRIDDVEVAVDPAEAMRIADALRAGAIATGAGNQPRPVVKRAP